MDPAFFPIELQEEYDALELVMEWEPTIEANRVLSVMLHRTGEGYEGMVAQASGTSPLHLLVGPDVAPPGPYDIVAYVPVSAVQTPAGEVPLATSTPVVLSQPFTIHAITLRNDHADANSGQT